MRCTSWMAIALIFGALAGCNGSSSDQSATPRASTESGTQTGDGSVPLAASNPSEAVNTFLDAVRTGNDEVATAMFTPLAQQKAKDLEIEVAPRGSDTARFEVGNVEMMGNEGARVLSKWTDMDRNGQPRTDEITWMLRREAEGWRVAGMAATVFEGEPPLLLDFEQPEETMRRLDLLREEVQRRMAKDNPANGQPANAAVQPADGTTANIPPAPANPGTATPPPGSPAEVRTSPAPENKEPQQTARTIDPFQRK